MRRLQDESFDSEADRVGRIEDAEEELLIKKSASHSNDPSALDLGYVTVDRFRSDLLSDLNHLLRTTRLAIKPLGDRFPELRKSIYNYGLPDRAGFGYSDSDRARLADEIAVALRVFEPRLQRINVEAQEGEIEDSAAVFSIHAQLRIPPRLEAVRMAATLPVHSKVFTVKDQPLPQEAQNLYDFYLNLIEE